MMAVGRSVHNKQTNKLQGLSPPANYTDRATAVCRRTDCQLLRIKGATWSAWRIPTVVFSVIETGAATFLSSNSSAVLTRLSGPRSRPITFLWQCRESNPCLRICSQELWPLDHRGGRSVHNLFSKQEQVSSVNFRPSSSDRQTNFPALKKASKL
jgi:hypothetical protein